jgi:hypothetical protein
MDKTAILFAASKFAKEEKEKKIRRDFAYC